jgi:hypothetical protein
MKSMDFLSEGAGGVNSHALYDECNAVGGKRRDFMARYGWDWYYAFAKPLTRHDRHNMGLTVALNLTFGCTGAIFSRIKDSATTTPI